MYLAEMKNYWIKSKQHHEQLVPSVLLASMKQTQTSVETVNQAHSPLSLEVNRVFRARLVRFKARRAKSSVCHVLQDTVHHLKGQ